jgi:hypothetical protein
LLDLKALDEYFARAFGDAGVLQVWFAQMIQSALITIVTDAYADFGTLGGVALDMMAARRDMILSSADRTQILGAMRTQPAHREVAEVSRVSAVPG